MNTFGKNKNSRLERLYTACKQKIGQFSMQIPLVAERVYSSQTCCRPDSWFLLLHTPKPPTQLFPIWFFPSYPP